MTNAINILRDWVSEKPDLRSARLEIDPKQLNVYLAESAKNHPNAYLATKKSAPWIDIDYAKLEPIEYLVNSAIRDIALADA